MIQPAGDRSRVPDEVWAYIWQFRPAVRDEDGVLQCYRCGEDACPVRLSHAGRGDWQPVPLCGPCIADAHADPRFMVVRVL